MPPGGCSTSCAATTWPPSSSSRIVACPAAPSAGSRRRTRPAVSGAAKASWCADVDPWYRETAVLQVQQAPHRGGVQLRPGAVQDAPRPPVLGQPVLGPAQALLERCASSPERVASQVSASRRTTQVRTCWCCWNAVAAWPRVASGRNHDWSRLAHASDHVTSVRRVCPTTARCAARPWPAAQSSGGISNGVVRPLPTRVSRRQRHPGEAQALEVHRGHPDQPVLLGDPQQPLVLRRDVVPVPGPHPQRRGERVGHAGLRRPQLVPLRDLVVVQRALRHEPDVDAPR